MVHALPELSPPEIAHAGEYVLGFPVHVALTIGLDPTSGVRSILACLPEESIYGIAFVRASFERLDDPGEAKILVEPPPRWGEALERTSLRAGERRRMVFDLSDLGLSALRPGRYRVSLDYVGLPSRAFEVSFRAPSEDERSVLARLSPDLARARTWGIWAKTRPVAGPAPTPHIARTDPLRYNRVLQYLFFASEPLSQVPAFLFGCLDGFYAPEAQLLRAELARSRDDASFAAEEGRLRADHPALLYLLERSIRHGSVYEWERRIRATLGL